MGAMIVKLDITDALRRPGERIPFTHEARIEPQTIMGDYVTFDTVRMEGSFSLIDGKLHLKGKLATVAHGSCANCLEAADYPVRLRFHEIFFRKGETDEHEEDEPDQTDRLAYDGPQLAVDQLALTLVVLDLPMRFLCREDCEGLLSITKTNREADADHENLTRQHPFSALQQLLNKDEEV